MLKESPTKRQDGQEHDAERSVLAAMLLDADAIPMARALLDAEAFHLDAHRFVFDSICALIDRGELAVLNTVAEELARRGDLGAVGGPSRLSHVMDGATTSANLGSNASVVLAAWARRRILRLALDAQQRAEDPTSDLRATLEHVQSESSAARVILARAELARHAR